MTINNNVIEDHHPLSTSERSDGVGRAARAATIVLPMLFFAAGVAMAIRYVDVNAAPGETGSAALTFLRTGAIADPYRTPTGPTAHVSPLVTLYLAEVFRLFGPNTPLARIVLSIVAAASYSLSVFLTLRICWRSNRLFWIAAGLMIVFPLFLFASSIGSRQWDQPFANLVAIAVAALLFAAPSSSILPLLGIAVLCGLGALLSPTLLPTFLCALVMFAWQRRDYFSPVKSIVIGLAIVSACLLPWAIRNELSLGKFILTRSSFPLEFAVGNAAGAIGISGTGTGLALHPYESRSAAAEVARLGEVQYMEKMKGIGISRVTNNFGEFLRVTGHRIVYSVLMPGMVKWEPPFGARASTFVLFFGALHIAALVLIVLLRGPLLFAMAFTVLPLCPYWITHVNFRYLSIVYFPSVVIIAWVIAEVGVYLGKRKPVAG